MLRKGATPAKRNDEANKQHKHSQDIIPLTLSTGRYSNSSQNEWKTYSQTDGGWGGKVKAEKMKIIIVILNFHSFFSFRLLTV